MNDPAATPDAAERRSRLLGIQLRALVAEHLGDPDLETEPGGFPHGAALTVDGSAWVLIDGPAGRSLGGALAWAVRHAATELHVIATADTGSLARRAERFAFPISVWFAQERTLLPAVGEPLVVSPSASAEHLDVSSLIEAGGAVRNIEHGVVFGEVRGLEVCRVVDEPTIGHIAELGDLGLDASGGFMPPAASGVQLEVGVGANDREAFRLIHGELPTVEALASVVDAVSTHRSAEARQHPLNRLGQERFLRWRLEQDPSIVGLASVVPAEPPSPRPNLKDPIPCVASGTDAVGSITTIVCSVGVDLDLVGFIADVQTKSPAPVMVVAPTRDLVPITLELLGLLADPVSIIAVD